jgi:hypothetical protein
MTIYVAQRKESFTGIRVENFFMCGISILTNHPLCNEVFNYSGIHSLFDTVVIPAIFCSFFCATDSTGLVIRNGPRLRPCSYAVLMHSCPTTGVKLITHLGVTVKGTKHHMMFSYILKPGPLSDYG